MDLGQIYHSEDVDYILDINTVESTKPNALPLVKFVAKPTISKVL